MKDIEIYKSPNGNTEISVKLNEETVWLSQQQMAELFETSRTNIVEHIKHIYEEGELEEISTCRKFDKFNIIRKLNWQRYEKIPA